MEKILVWDTRQQSGKHDHILSWFEKHNYKIVRNKLFCGDVTYLQNMSVCIDTKKDILEVVGNVTQQHLRFTNEIDRAVENGIRLVFLIQDENVTCLDDLDHWINPRRRYSEKAVKGYMLKKILKTIEERHQTKFYFCKKDECAETIIKILDGEM